MKTETQKLSNGTVNILSDNGVNIRVYNTNDAIQDQVIVVDREGKGVVIELPCFKNSIEEMTRYLNEEKIDIVAKLVSYHAAGSSFLPGVKNYLTPSSAKYNTDGEGAGLVKNFAGNMGRVRVVFSVCASALMPAMYHLSPLRRAKMTYLPG